MNYLYLLTEDDNDDLFFEACLEKLSGLSFQLDNTRIRMRKGTGITETRRMLRRVLQDLQRIGRQENTYLVVTIDNDRSVTHPLLYQSLPARHSRWRYAITQHMNHRTG